MNRIKIRKAGIFTVFFHVFICLSVSANRGDDAKTQFKWKEPGITINLEDQLRAKEMSWPRTLLEYAIDFSDSPVPERSLTFISVPSKQSIPFQFTNIQKAGDKIIKATFCFFSDLASGERKEFRLIRASSDFDMTSEPSVIVLISGKY